MNSEIMTMEEVAEYLRVSVRTIYEWAHKGEIPCGKIGTVWRFKRTEMERWVDDRLAASGKPSAPPSICPADIFSAERITILDTITRVESFNQLLGILHTSSGIRKAKELSEEVYRRENLMSTAIGLGFAVPHARLSSVKSMEAAVGISPVGILDYEALDDIPVYVIIMVAANKRQHSEYLRLLSYLTSLIKQEDIREKLITARDPFAAYDILASGSRAGLRMRGVPTLKS
ncbi:MAG: helix-turn-helix domain-containing protein [Chitinivibrionales bacterium]|nr:helix-turn-helix domain-containing protein [Chitinivibrionales bacterium]